jgi:hypothetical protein
MSRSSAIRPRRSPTKNGRKLYGAGASAFVLGTEVAILRGIDPIAADPALVELAAAGLDTPSDTGLTLAVTDLDGAGFGFRFSQGASSTAEGLALHFPPDAAGVLTREAGDGAKFVPQDVEFDAMGVREMLLGSGEGRCLVRLAAPGRARGAVESEGYRIELPGTFAFDLVTVFEDEARAALELNRQAAAARNRADYAEALDRIQEVLESNPHDLAAVGVARQMRSDILGELDRRVQELNTEGAQARFFEAMVGYRRVKDGIDRLIEAYGERHVPELSSLQQLSRDMVAGIETLERASGKQHGEKLKVLVDAFESSGQPKLATVVRDYIAKHYAELQKDEPQKEGGR